MKKALFGLLFIYSLLLPVISYSIDLGPVRLPSGRDRSISLTSQNQCRWWNVAEDQELYPSRTATQRERASLYVYGVANLMPEGLTYAKYTKGCLSVALGQAKSDFETDNLRLRYFYVDKLRDKEWGIFSGGCPDYSHVLNLGRRLQACSTQNNTSRESCATNPYLTKDILDWTNMEVVGGRCYKTSVPVVVPSEEDNSIAEMGHLKYTVPLPPLTELQKSKANEVMTLHHQAALAKCGKALSPPKGSVKAAEVAFMESAIDERQRHAFLMVFTGSTDKAWSPQDLCDFGMIEHFAWHAWNKCFDLPGLDMWPCLTRARVTHESIHAMAAHKNNSKFRVSPDHQMYPMDVTPMTSQQFLACIRDDTLNCRPQWIPSDWRIILE